MKPSYPDLLKSLGAGLQHGARDNKELDWISRDGRHGVELKIGGQGVRDLAAAAFQLASWVAEDPTRHGTLVLRTPLLSHERVKIEWTRLRDLLRPDVARRMSLVIPGIQDPKFRSADPAIRRLCRLLEEEPDPLAPRAWVGTTLMTPKVFEAIKLVMAHWLRHSPPLTARQVQKEAGVSYPTVVKAFRKLQQNQELSRRRDRRVELTGFPRRTWQEILPMAGSLRRTVAFVDASGRSSDPVALLRRLEQSAPQAVAVGGVEAARHWDRRFNLRGVPRLDISVHAPAGSNHESFVKRLNPALEAARAASQEPALVLHPLLRSESLFTSRPSKRLPVADPVETLLDLHELRLVEQAEELVERFGPK